jgi:hypothetical protein
MRVNLAVPQGPLWVASGPSETAVGCGHVQVRHRCRAHSEFGHCWTVRPCFRCSAPLCANDLVGRLRWIDAGSAVPRLRSIRVPTQPAMDALAVANLPLRAPVGRVNTVLGLVSTTVCSGSTFPVHRPLPAARFRVVRRTERGPGGKPPARCVRLRFGVMRLRAWRRGAQNRRPYNDMANTPHLW